MIILIDSEQERCKETTGVFISTMQPWTSQINDTVLFSKLPIQLLEVSDILKANKNLWIFPSHFDAVTIGPGMLNKRLGHPDQSAADRGLIDSSVWTSTGPLTHHRWYYPPIIFKGVKICINLYEFFNRLTNVNKINDQL